MTRAELEAFIDRQLTNLAPAADPKARDITRIVIMARVDAYAKAAVEAAGAEAEIEERNEALRRQMKDLCGG